ncbi:DNA polymerase III subunit beta [Nitrosomonas supralitoralis]|uniref:Beta sliding clamp n=1 Tax=Nitrosomonas supralitoralis TaxID=2116706 RepID=A0A2P7NVM7_9PROT|nr:DNA polymerase III subunit beta [Nitrosomonas supralitoralis]PSJ17530.1 DNA polymerase III subunit beta [Nitrosomonas supralitoralis]
MLLIKTNRDTLLKPLQTVTGIVERRQTLPILSNVLIEQNHENTSFLTSDLEMQIKTVVIGDLSSQQGFALTVSAKKLQDILRSLSSDTEVTLTRKSDHLQVNSGKSAFSLQILPAEDFPQVTEETESGSTITLKQKELKDLLHFVQFAVAQQDIRYYLNGLLLLVDGKQLISVGTDGHRLAYISTDLDKIQNKQEVILPRKAVYELSKLLDDSEDPVKIEYFQNKVRFSFSNIILISKVIDGKFPDYNRVIPTRNNKLFDINRLIFLHALQRVSILSNQSDKFRGVRLIVDENNLRIICKNNEQEEAEEQLEINYHDDPVDISLNITYLMDLLNNVTSESVQCAFENANNSVLMTIPGNEIFKYIVMPMRI